MGFWSMLFAKVQYQILILGLDDAGKTVRKKAGHEQRDIVPQTRMSYFRRALMFGSSFSFLRRHFWSKSSTFTQAAVRLKISRSHPLSV
jgi:hypothetical protein